MTASAGHREAATAAHEACARLAPRAVTRLALPLPAGTWRVALAADGAVGLAAVTALGAIRVRIHAGAAVIALDAPIDGFDVWPLDEPVADVKAVAVPLPPWDTLTPDWRLGPVRQPPRTETAPRTRPETPAGWTGVRIAEAEAVTVAGNRFAVAENGILSLELTPPRGPGPVLVTGEFRDETGAPAWVEPQVLAVDAASPRTRLAAMRREAGATHSAVLHLSGTTQRLLLRPREYAGTVVIDRLVLRPLSPPERAARAGARLAREAASRWQVPRVGGGRAARTPRHPVRAAAPAVTVVTATRDAPHHLTRFLATIRATDYPGVQLVLVDNGSRDAEALRLLAEAEGRGATVLRDERPFNFAALNNLGARSAAGDILVFANNDIEFTEPGWLHALVEAVEAPGVGVAGARLLYPDGRVQHAGLVLAGEARVRHAERFLSGRAPGYQGRQRRRSEVVGVTGALMAIRRSLFDALGGFDAARYAVLFNDVDLCLRVRARGLANVLVPGSLALHHESATIGQRRTTGLFARGGEIWQYERAVEGHRFRQDWADMLDADPFYPPQFDPLDARFRRRV
ncbi:glycosyltransferase family 2 protein [Acuticoccus sediminis]|uniref:glycosyltransferase family 2 protein n=1 Tax=Acuticoccus sediminis TaxID=2184697 RepID=UPI001CFCC96A|nr:glycosyltransferase family 2 protein [Acuticoccus sediminis]